MVSHPAIELAGAWLHVGTMAGWHTGGVDRPLAAAPADGRRRAEILAAAAELFASAGYVGTSLKDVADACGILPGSLYHHFECKESIAVELLERYQTDLDAVARRTVGEDGDLDRDTAFSRILSLANDIAACALRHRAALQLSQYQPHASASQTLIALARKRPDGLTAAMRTVLDQAQAVGYLKASIDLDVLTEQVVETMLHTGLLSLHRESTADRVAAVLCRLIFQGIAARLPTDRDLDRSAAMLAARHAVDGWPDPDQPRQDDRFAQVRSVAREEFARRGYEATTVRDIAAAVGTGPGNVYRLVESKQALLASIMGAFHAALSKAYDEVVTSDSTAVAKLDALIWVNLNAVTRFDREFVIQRAWFRSSPPPDPSGMFGALKRRSRQIKTVVEDGQRSAEFQVDGVPMSRLVACVRDLIWLPPTVVERAAGERGLAHARATVLGGAAYRRHG